VKLSHIAFVSGATVNVPAAVTAIVGPNNVGKSTVLRELQTHFARNQYQDTFSAQIVAGYELEPGANSGPLQDLLDAVYGRRPAGQHPEGFYSEVTWRLPNDVITMSEVLKYWNSSAGLGGLAPFFSTLLDASGRLHLANTAQSYNVLSETPSTPVQRLYADRDLERALSKLTTTAFGKPITVNRYAGSQITIHVGSPVAHETQAPPSVEYLQELADLPLVDHQGDGFRAFIGMVLSVLAGSYPLVLIDEPEAFLHPPQARLLGRFLAEQHSSGTQVIVATHSEDIVAGITDRRGGGASIVRLARDEHASSVAQLTPEAVQRLYDDPLIRYYDMLNGLFVRGVVICEADSDCTYYRAVAEEIDLTTGIDSGLHFTHTGGKARIHVALEAFRQTNIPVATVVDIDLLQNDLDFVRLVEAAGGDPADFARSRRVVTAAVSDRTLTKSVVAARAEIEQYLSQATGDVTSGLSSKISDALRGRSGWKEFKTQGKRMLTSDALAAFETLDEGLRQLGIFLVPVGELENFHTQYSAANKAQWLRSVLESRAYEEQGPARDLIQEVMDFASHHQLS
jgi:hypothetical protein